MTKKADSTKHPRQRKISNEVSKAEVSLVAVGAGEAAGEWVRHTGARIVAVFEGRDAAVVESDIKKHARLNMMAHLLSSIYYEDVEVPVVDLPERPVRTGNYDRPPRELSTYVDDYVATLLRGSW